MSGSGPSDAQDEALVPVSGILDIGGNNAFIRTSGYRLGPDDVYVPAAQVRQYGLRKGDLIVGDARRPGHRDDTTASRNGGPGRPRQKSGTLARVETVNGMPPTRDRPDFDSLTPLHANERIRLEAGSASPTARIIDLVSPIGKGQRGLIVSPPKAGKTMVLKAIAAAIAAGYPGVHLMMVLVGERPEEVTDIRRSVRGEVVFSTFDRYRLPDGRRVLRRVQGHRQHGAAAAPRPGGEAAVPGGRCGGVSTRRDNLLMSSEEHTAVSVLRRALAGLDAQQALELLLDRTYETSSNAEFLLQRQGLAAQARRPQAVSSVAWS